MVAPEGARRRLRHLEPLRVERGRARQPVGRRESRSRHGGIGLHSRPGPRRLRRHAAGVLPGHRRSGAGHSAGPGRLLAIPRRSGSRSDVDGLIRLFVSTPEIVDYVCNAPAWDPSGPPGDPRPAPAARAAFIGATGNGVERPGVSTHGQLAAGPQEPPQRRGEGGPSSWAPARAGAGAATTAGSPGTRPRGPSWPPSSAPTTSRSTSVSPRTRSRSSIHQGLFPGSVQGIYCTGRVEDYNYAELLANCRLRNGEVIPRVADMLEFIFTRTNLPTWLDSKRPGRHRAGRAPSWATSRRGSCRATRRRRKGCGRGRGASTPAARRCGSGASSRCPPPTS